MLNFGTSILLKITKRIVKQRKMIFLMLFSLLFLGSVSPLRIDSSHFTHNLQRSIQHNLQTIQSHSYSKGHNEEIPDKVFNDLKDFVANDTEITNRIHAQKPLNKASSEKVKDYFLGNQEFKYFTLKNLVSESQDPSCLDNLSERGSDKLFKIILDQVDFSTIFLPQMRDQEFTKQQVREIVFQLKTDKELCPALEKCFSKTKH